MTEQKEKQKRFRTYLLRSLGLVLVFILYILLVHLLINYLGLLFSWIKESLTSFTANTAKTGSVSAPQIDLPKKFAFQIRYLIDTPATIPPWVPYAAAALLTALSGWKIVRKIERLVSKFGVDYYYKEIEGSSRFASQKELEQYLTPVEKTKMNVAEQCGIILAEDAVNYYMDTTDSNTLIVGTTRSGKGQLLVLNSIRAMASGKNKTSMVVLDPKGENIRDTYSILKKEGYRVLVLNYRDPNKSLQNNPLWPTIQEYVKYQEKAAALAQKIAADPKYIPSDEEHPDLGKVEELLSDLTYLITADKTAEKIWPESASNLLKAMIYYLLDVGFANNTIEELTMYTVYVFFVEKGSMPAAGVAGDPHATQLDLAFHNLAIDHPARLAYATSRFASGEMKSSIFATLASNLQIFRDAGMVRVTSGNTVDFSLLADPVTPTAIFLIIPDEKPSRHILASISIKQCYSELIDLSTQYDGVLPRRVAFVCDEFGNMPPLQNMGNIVSASLSRNILWHLYIQNFSQLADKYGQETATTIRSNVANLVYILASDLNTNKEISEIMGAGTKEYSSFTGEHGSILEAETATTHLKGRSLQTPDELFRTGKWELFVMRTRCFTIRSKITPFFELKIPQTSLSDIIKDVPPSPRSGSGVMRFNYEEDLTQDTQSAAPQNIPAPLFAANIRPADLEKEPDINLEFSLTTQICQMTKNEFARALDESNFALARKLVQDKLDTSLLTGNEAAALMEMINRYEREEALTPANGTSNWNN